MATSVSPLNIDQFLGKPRNRVARIGVELEGAWLVVPKGVQLVGDGSVFNSGTAPSGHKTGELQIGPIQVAQLPLSLKKYYPTVVDKSCGMHVHMSFETLYHYAVLADSPVYQETVVEYLKRWATEEALTPTHPIWDRLDNKNRFCKKEFWPEKQMHTNKKNYSTEEGSRYTMISYQWGRYRTVECRVLPMMKDAPLAVKAIRRLVDITNAYLLTAAVKAKVRERNKLRSIGAGSRITMTLKKGEVYEEYSE